MSRPNPVNDAPNPDRTFGFRARLSAPLDVAPLVYFRLVFGAMLLWEAARFLQLGWIRRYYVEPEFFFKYYGFEWVRPWPPLGMYWHFAALGVLALMILLGLRYRIATVLFFLGFTYVFLLDQANYLNHFYLISLISLLLIYVPAHRAFSLDAVRNPEIRARTAPAWTLWLLRFQIAVPYVYGGIAKLNADWLAGEPMRAWLSERTGFPLIGRYFTSEVVVYAFAYGGLLFDLLIVPLLLWRKTRWLGVAWLLLFHVLNAQLFQIGIFPWFMLLATPVFFPPEWIPRLLERCGLRRGEAPGAAPATYRPLPKVACWALAAFVAFQLLFPLRHLLYPGNPSWTEEGHRFSWHMKLRDKAAKAEFLVRDAATNETWLVRSEDYLTDRQWRKMRSRPDMILQFCHHLARAWRKKGHPDVQVHARVMASLNGRPPQWFIDPRVDLSKQPRSLRHAPWVFPLGEALLKSRAAMAPSPPDERNGSAPSAPSPAAGLAEGS